MTARTWGLVEGKPADAHVINITQRTLLQNEKEGRKSRGHLKSFTRSHRNDNGGLRKGLSEEEAILCH